MATAVLSPVVAAPPLFTPTDKYPTSPIISSPQASPIPPRPLRERCGVNMSLRLTTTISPVLGPWSPKAYTQPHRVSLPRRRKVTKRYFANIEKDDDETLVEKNETVIDLTEKSTPVFPGAPKEQDSHIQELIPGLFVAFSEGDPNAPQPGDSIEKPYSHVVNIAYPPTSEEEHKGSCNKFIVGYTQRLHITLPSSSRIAEGRPGLGLTDGHLRSIRDFIGEALPHSVASSTEESNIRVLITTPFGRPTDAMCAAGCYLAFVSGQRVESVLSYIDEEEEFLSIWKAEVSGDEMERAQKIAKAWSYLTQIAGPPPKLS
ncbi:hypothetical protein QCA50_005350 [Cerrena zonata]|uniref:Uncharacterized protein n=1 Tax=Cerrena zonata TaxID=2478898 RepID=A0AAW0GRR4_9APHY